MTWPARTSRATPTTAVVLVPEDVSHTAPRPPRAVSARPRPIMSGIRRVRTGYRAARGTGGRVVVADFASAIAQPRALSCFMARSPSRRPHIPVVAHPHRPAHEGRLLATQPHILHARGAGLVTVATKCSHRLPSRTHYAATV